MQENATQSSRATELLCAAHEALRDLLCRLRDSAAANAELKRGLIVEVGHALRAHGRIERDVFYPAVVEVAGASEARGFLEGALAEHERAELALARLERVDPTSMGFRPAVRSLADVIDDHANNEEGLVFPRVRKLVDVHRLRELGARMESLRASLSREVQPRAALPATG